MKIIFIVNGVDVSVNLELNQFIKTGRNKALKLSNNMGRPVDEWEIHNDDGEPISPNKSVKKLGLEDSDRLFLNLAVGFGGYKNETEYFTPESVRRRITGHDRRSI